MSGAAAAFFAAGDAGLAGDSDALRPSRVFRARFAREGLDPMNALEGAAFGETMFSGVWNMIMYRAIVRSNRGAVVHLQLYVYEDASGLRTTRLDLLWDMATNALGVYAQEESVAEAREMLSYVFPRATIATARFSDVVAHYAMPDLGGYDGPVRSLAVVEFAVAPDGAGASPSGVVRLATAPAGVRAGNLYHYAALCKYGWTCMDQGTPGGKCPIAFMRPMYLPSGGLGAAGSGLAGVLSGLKRPAAMLALARGDGDGDGDGDDLVTYKTCSFCVHCVHYDAPSQTMHFTLLGTFSDAEPSAPYGDVTFTARFRWNLEHDVIYFPDGDAKASSLFYYLAGERSLVGVEARACWLFDSYAFCGFLNELYGWNLPRVLWNAASAERFAREIVGGLEWLSAFRAATRGRLPEAVYHRIGMSQVPAEIRRAYAMADDVLPLAKRRRTDAQDRGDARGPSAPSVRAITDADIRNLFA